MQENKGGPSFAKATEGKEEDMSLFGAILLSIIAFDLLTTSVGIGMFQAREEHPLLLSYYLLFGINGLIIAKLWIHGWVLFVLEAAYQYELIPRPLMRAYYQYALAIYLLPYLTLTYYYNIIPLF